MSPKRKCIRNIHIDNYRFTKQRFRSDLVFQTQGGISVIWLQCAESATKMGICAHIVNHYPHFQSPTMFWGFYYTELKKSEGCENLYFEQQPTETEDKCHYNLFGISEETATSFADKFCVPPNIFICQNNKPVEITQAMIIDLKNWAKQRNLM
jgi:hypothetical protein